MPTTSVSLSPEAVDALHGIGALRAALEAVIIVAGALEPDDAPHPPYRPRLGLLTVLPFRLLPGVRAVRDRVNRQYRRGFSRWADHAVLTYHAEAGVYLSQLSPAERAEVANLAISRAAPCAPYDARGTLDTHPAV